MGNLHQEGTDRSTCTGRFVVESYHSGCYPLSDNSVGKRHSLKDVFSEEEYETLSAEPRRLIRKISAHIAAVTTKVDEMVEARKKANRITDMREKAITYHDTVAPYLDEIRDHIDDLELMVDNQSWPLPKYRELLFIR